MLTISTPTEHKAAVLEAIATIDRLDELVTIAAPGAAVEGPVLLVRNGELTAEPDWYDRLPPLLLPTAELTQENLLIFVFLLIGNAERALELVEEGNPLTERITLLLDLKYGNLIADERLHELPRGSHDRAVLLHYGNLAVPYLPNDVSAAYEEAMQHVASSELRAFTAKHYVNFLLDRHELRKAEEVLRGFEDEALSPAAQNALNAHRANILMSRAAIPYDDELLQQALELKQKCIAYAHANELPVQEGMLLIDAAEVANKMGEHAKAKDLINSAILIFKKEQIPELLGEAGLKKAIHLYTWAKAGCPQFYKAAVNAFQDTLKVFKRDSHPARFAEIHHNLALIYSEMPVSSQEKPLWAAFSASSFNQVMEILQKDEHPYEYAMACHNYATALMDYPPAKLHNNLEKAQGLFSEALQIRNAERYPLERSLTLLNQLQLHWLMADGRALEDDERERIVANAQEVATLVSDPDLLRQAAVHLERTEEIRSIAD